MKGITWVALTGFVGAVLSSAFTVPTGLRVLHIIAAGGAMAGYAVGDYATRDSKRYLVLVWATILMLIVLATSSLSYTVLLAQGMSGPLFDFTLGILVGVTFFCLAYLMAAAGVIVSRPE